MSCPNCSSMAPIQDEGWLLFQANQPAALEKLHTLRVQEQLELEHKDSPFSLGYRTKDQLLQVLNVLQSRLSEEEQESLLLDIREPGRPEWIHGHSLTFRQFNTRMQQSNIVSLILEGRFTSHMQPIVDMATQQVVAYEFLLRAAEGGPAFRPFELFSVAQQTGLHSFLDRSARISAIQVSALHLPKGYKRFVNFLPSSIYNPNYCLSHTFQAINRFSLDPGDFVFEVVETEKIEDIDHLKNIFAVYRQHGIKVALDDVGSGFSTVDVLSELKPDFVKIDRGLVDRCDEDEAKQRKITEILRTADSYGAVVLAEGMERKEEWQFCKDLGVDLAQGYLLGKPAPKRMDPEQITI
jgi:EAL domain-containing protein (putative c-di-GMP-specific phosphodiesterase class I)